MSTKPRDVLRDVEIELRSLADRLYDPQWDQTNFGYRSLGEACVEIMVDIADEMNSQAHRINKVIDKMDIAEGEYEAWSACPDDPSREPACYSEKHGK